LAGRSFDVSSFLAIEDANSNQSDSQPCLCDRLHRPTQQFAAKVAIVEREYRRIGDGMNAREGLAAFVSHARRID
jgi:hypothetical protein